MPGKGFRFFFLFVLLSAACPVFAAETPPGGEPVVYPAGGSGVETSRPMVAVDFSPAGIEIDPARSAIYLNGVDVTEESEVTPFYIIYRPSADMEAGDYSVRVEAVLKNGPALEPIVWRFWITAPVDAPVSPPAPLEQKQQVRGRMAVSVDNVSARYTPDDDVDVTGIFAEQEGSKVNISFDASSRGAYSADASYYRYTDDYEETAEDRGLLSLRRGDLEVMAGNFWLEYSDLSVAGTELAGIYINNRAGGLDLRFFSGRSQDYTESGTFKQTATGFSASLEKTNTLTSASIIFADEKDDAVYSAYSSPTTDMLISVKHDSRLTRSTSVSFEAASNEHNDADEPENERGRAFRATMTRQRKGLLFSAGAYGINDNFVPVAEGSTKYLLSNKEGYDLRLGWNPGPRFGFDAYFEKYDRSQSDDFDKQSIENGSAYFTIAPRPALPYFTVAKSRLTSSIGTVSDSDSISMTLDFKNTHGPAKFYTLWRDSEYEDTSTYNFKSESDLWYFSLSSPLTSTLDLYTVYSLTDYYTVTSNSGSDTKTLTLDLAWEAVPGVLRFDGSYELEKSGGDDIDREEEIIGLVCTWIAGDQYSIALAGEVIDYIDNETDSYNYDQFIIRFGVEYRF